jgi:hypothetical protein
MQTPVVAAVACHGKVFRLMLYVLSPSQLTPMAFKIIAVYLAERTNAFTAANPYKNFTCFLFPLTIAYYSTFWEKSQTELTFLTYIQVVLLKQLWYDTFIEIFID